MRGGWRRFGLYIVAVLVLIGLVFVATRDESRTAGLVVAQVVFVGGMSYLLTFIVWPRRAAAPRPKAAKNDGARPTPGPARPQPEADPRPVAVIGNRPAGSKPGERVHIPDVPTSRSSRGRRPDRRQPTGDFKWPAQR